jgi:5-methylcytosine-specific restriction endonuclease McrA
MTAFRETFARDGLQCAYVSPDGRRCTARAFLEVDHVEPRARGGGDHADNLRVLCSAHNQLAAEQAYGRDHVERARHLRQQKQASKREATR